MRRTDSTIRGCDPNSLLVREIMEDDVVTCDPRTDGGTIVEMLTTLRFGSIPVVGEEKRLLGLVSEYDLLEAVVQGRDLRKMTAEAVMVRDVLTVTEDQRVEELARLFQDRYLTRVPVVRGKQLVGIVARRDLLTGYLKALKAWS